MIKIKIAIISDIHGNIEALKATLKDIKNKNIDKIYCLGDIIAKGTHPEECVKLVRENCEIVLRGNCDRNFSLEHKDIENLPKIEQKRINWNQSLLTKETREYLQNLPFSLEFYMSGSLIRMFHATPESDKVAVTNYDSITKKLEMFYPSDKIASNKIADVVIYGHLHQQFMDKLYNKTLINVGSVGNAFDVIRNPKKDSNVLETIRSNYLILEGEYGSMEYNSDISFQFVKVPYDIDKELENEEINLEKEDYRYELKEGMYRDMTKIQNNFKNIGIDVNKI